jgi:actin-related protein 5
MSPSKVKTEEPELPPQSIHLLKDAVPPLTLQPFYQNYHTDVPIAIDLGTNSTTIGVINDPNPNNVFPSVVSKYRDRKAMNMLTLVGSDAYRDPSTKSSSRFPFDGQFITNWEYVEAILDYSFEHLSVTSNNGRVNNPIIMSEPVCCPLNQRKLMYELLFEAYQVPKIAFGIDSLFSYHYNTDSPSSNGLVINVGNEQTHVIPVLEGKGILSQTKRIDWGGNSCQNYLSKLLALKYPYFPTKLNYHHTNNLFKDFCYVSTDYQSELKSYLDMENLEKNDILAQVPVDFSQHQEKKKSEEELAKQAAKRREQGKRLQEQARQKRMEKMLQKQQEWDYYSKFQEDIAGLSKAELLKSLQADGFDDMDDFKKYMASLEKALKKVHTEHAENDDEEHDDSNVNPASAWPLVDIPDDQLTEEQIKEKRKQKLHKGNFEAREKVKELKRQEEVAKAQYEQEQKEWREKDLEDWCSTKRIQLAELTNKYQDRAKLIESFKDRKSVAAQERMKNIASLANDETGSTSAASRKRRRNANTSIDNDPNDNFGANDEDWGIYRDITNVNLEEEQEENYNSIQAVEEELLRYDPNFHHEDTLAAAQTFDWKNLVLHKFIHGPRPNITLAMQSEGMEADEIANHPAIIQKSHQMHLNIERIRVPEIFFEPHIAGLDQAGICEILSDLLLRRLDGNFSPGGQSYSLVQDVFLTGGGTKLLNFRERITNDFRSFLPVGTPLNVRSAKDPELDAWRGMQKWGNSELSTNGYVTQKEYDEYGPEYIKEHGLGNIPLR